MMRYTSVRDTPSVERISQLELVHVKTNHIPPNLQQYLDTRKNRRSRPDRISENVPREPVLRLLV